VRILPLILISSLPLSFPGLPPSSPLRRFPYQKSKGCHRSACRPSLSLLFRFISSVAVPVSFYPRHWSHRNLVLRLCLLKSPFSTRVEERGHRLVILVPNRSVVRGVSAFYFMVLCLDSSSRCSISPPYLFFPLFPQRASNLVPSISTASKLLARSGPPVLVSSCLSSYLSLPAQDLKFDFIFFAERSAKSQLPHFLFLIFCGFRESTSLSF